MKIALWLVAIIFWIWLASPVAAASGAGMVIVFAVSLVIGWFFRSCLAGLYEDRRLKREGIWPDRRKYRDIR